MSPTSYGGAESLSGHAFLHVDPHGMASICKVGRDPQISLLEEGVEGLYRLGGVADSLLLRQGSCAGCATRYPS